MCSNIFLLLAVYCVVVSGVKIDLHVKNVESGYTTLEFTDGDTKTKAFSLGTADTGTNNIKIKTGGKIEETDLELAFAPKAAAILPVFSALAIKVENQGSGCVTGKNCFEAAAGKTYYLRVAGVQSDHNKLSCGSVEFTLKHDVDAQNNEIKVERGTIHEFALTIGANSPNCKIEGTGGVPPDINIPLGCTDAAKCLKENKATTKLHVSCVSKLHTKIIFTDTAGATQEFTLDAAKPTDDKNIKVENNGVINENTVPLTLDPIKCEVEEVTLLPWIPIVESAECATGSKNCFKNKAESGQDTTSFAASIKSIKLVLVAVCMVLGKL